MNINMKMKKTWFSYLLWMSFVVITAAFAADYLPAAMEMLFKGNQYTAVKLVFAMAVLAAACWFVGHKTASAFADMLARASSGASEKTSGRRLWKSLLFRQAVEAFLVFCLLAAAAFYRIQMLEHLDAPLDSIYYDMAFIDNAGGVPNLAHGASYCYALVLSAVFSFSGNKIAAGLALQAVLQIVTLLVLYLGIRRLAGKAEAFWVVAILSFLPSYAGKIYELEPETFYFALWSLGILLIGQCGMAEEKKASCTVFFLAGAYIGVMGFLDRSGWLLLLVAGGICIKRAMEGDGKKAAWGENCRDGGLVFLFCLLGAVVGMFCSLAGDAALSGSSFGSIWNTWSGLLSWRGSAWILQGPESDPIAGAALCFGNMLLATGFWFHKEQKQDVWILLWLVAAAYYAGAAGSFGYRILFAFAWAALAGLGIASMGISREAGEKGKTKVPELVLEDMDQEDEEEEKEESGVKLIENPLPLPKKHVRREMDFDRLVEWEKMKFDIPVDESDDFDI